MLPRARPALLRRAGPGSTCGESPLIPSSRRARPHWRGAKPDDRAPARPRAAPSSSTWQTTPGPPARATSSSSAESGGRCRSPISRQRAPSAYLPRPRPRSRGFQRRTRGRDAAARAAMSRGSRRLPRWTKSRASAERSSVRCDRRASASGARARVRGRTLPVGLVGQRSLGLDVEDPDSGTAGEQRIASSEVTLGNAAT